MNIQRFKLWMVLSISTLLLLTMSTLGLAENSGKLRFEHRGATFFDRATELEWQTCAWPQKYFENSCIGEPKSLGRFSTASGTDSWEQNQREVANVVRSAAAKAGGTGWRMPTVEELETLSVPVDLGHRVEHIYMGGMVASETICSTYKDHPYCAYRLVAIGGGDQERGEVDAFTGRLSQYLRLVRKP